MTLIINWYVVLGVVALLGVASFSIYRFFKLPTKMQINNIKEWLLYAVINAERELGTKTGELKLLSTYNVFITKFPMVAKFISFETFGYWVDEALDKMKVLLAKNEEIQYIVDGIDI